MLHYKDILLYEDDLDDFGYSQLRLKARVQRDSIFILLRSYIRVDKTVIRVIDNRFFIDFLDFQKASEGKNFLFTFPQFSFYFKQIKSNINQIRFLL